jgi:hypothetical protein
MMTLSKAAKQGPNILLFIPNRTRHIEFVSATLYPGTQGAAGAECITETNRTQSALLACRIGHSDPI